LWQLDQGDTAGNVTHGDVLMEDTQNSYLRTEKGLLATIGIENMIVIVTDDAVLVAKKDAAQDVKKIVEQLKATNRPEPKTHTTVYRPWGSYHGVDIGDRFQVKRITVNPGGRLSLQKHAKRAEHWVVVSGRATVTRDDETLELGADQSTYIPIGMTHRLENKTDQPLHLIEIQSGDYLGEDDIVRLEDVYGRD
jgi:mannose-1-phosphate guanylyltransferase/mannose-6-phosphate isomerase